MIGIFAVQRKDRHLLACHTLLLWPCLALVATVGYIAYKDTIWDLKTTLGMKWRYDFDVNEQFALQETVSYVSYCSFLCGKTNRNFSCVVVDLKTLRIMPCIKKPVDVLENHSCKVVMKNCINLNLGFWIKLFSFALHFYPYIS